MAIRFMHSSWRHHYHAVTMAAVVAAFLPSLKKYRPPSVLLVATFALLLAVNSKHASRALALMRHGTIDYFDYCPQPAERQASLARARSILLQDPNARILVGMNLAPKLVALPHVLLLDAHEPDDAPPFRYVFFEKPPFGAEWPTTYERIRKAQDAWRAQADTQMLIDDTWLYFARGSFRDL